MVIRVCDARRKTLCGDANQEHALARACLFMLFERTKMNKCAPQAAGLRPSTVPATGRDRSSRLDQLRHLL